MLVSKIQRPSGLSRTARSVGWSLTATNAQDQVIGLSSHGYYIIIITVIWLKLHLILVLQDGNSYTVFVSNILRKVPTWKSVNCLTFVLEQAVVITTVKNNPALSPYNVFWSVSFFSYFFLGCLQRSKWTIFASNLPFFLSLQDRQLECLYRPVPLSPHLLKDEVTVIPVLAMKVYREWKYSFVHYLPRY